MLALGEHCSMTERRADDATREVDAWLKCEFLQDHVGDTFEGVVAAVTSFGLFVELSDLYIEGLVHISALPADYYHFDRGRQRLVGERSGRNFNLGDQVTVQVARVDLDEKKVDLELLDAKSRRESNRQAPARKSGKKTGKQQDKKSTGKPGKKSGAKKKGGPSRSGMRRRR
jgi:ribonuclease R